MTLKSGGRNLRPDATLRDRNNFPRGYWEAKDSADDLEAEIRKKSELKYPLTNIIFEDTERGILYQNKERVFTANLGDPRELADLLNRFYNHEEPDIEAFDLALDEFQQRVSDLATGLQAKIADAHAHNRHFQGAWNTFFSLCRLSLNPNISKDAVDEMLVQHLLTERLIRVIFRLVGQVVRVSVETVRIVNSLPAFE